MELIEGWKVAWIQVADVLLAGLLAAHIMNRKI